MMDEDGPKPKPRRLIAHPFGAWDVDDLREYIAELRAEIVRAEAAVDGKVGHRHAAEAFFKTAPG